MIISVFSRVWLWCSSIRSFTWSPQFTSKTFFQVWILRLKHNKCMTMCWKKCSTDSFWNSSKTWLEHLRSTTTNEIKIRRKGEISRPVDTPCHWRKQCVGRGMKKKHVWFKRTVSVILICSVTIYTWCQITLTPTPFVVIKSFTGLL